jgi:hypothetical protein
MTKLTEDLIEILKETLEQVAGACTLITRHAVSGRARKSASLGPGASRWLRPQYPGPFCTAEGARQAAGRAEEGGRRMRYRPRPNDERLPTAAITRCTPSTGQTIRQFDDWMRRLLACLPIPGEAVPGVGAGHANGGRPP